MTSLLDDLKQQIAENQTLVIVGAGVSMGATNRNPNASWIGLLHDGVKRCLDLSRIPDSIANLLRSQIDSGDLDVLLAAAETISSKLGAPADGEYRRWLRESVGSLTAENKEVLQALSELGVVLATTNYDKLIEEVTGLEPVTWMDESKVERVLRGQDKGVLHLHGYWDRPESVVLGIRSYEKVLGSEHAQTMQQAIAALKTILFVGCGDGLHDPNFGSLLEWTGKAFARSEYRRFRLALEGEREALQQKHPSEQRLFVLSYGEKHDDLAGFLQGLKPVRKSPEPADSPASPQPPVSQAFRLPARPRCFGREEDLRDLITELLADQPRPIPILGTAGIGKSTLTLAAMHDEKVAAHYGTRRFFIRCDGIKTRNSLAGEIARQIGLDPSPNIEPALLYELASASAILALDNAETPWEADILPVEELLEELSNVPKLALIASIRGNERPGGVRWREAFHPNPLKLSAARATFLDIGGENFATDPRLDDLLMAVDYLPLAIMLLAHASEGEPNLENVWHRWQAERTALLQRAGGVGRLTSIEVSYEFSLKSPRMTTEAMRLLKLLAMLPSGLAAKDLSLVMHRDGPAAAAVLRKLGLIFDETERLRLLAPLREYVHSKYSPEPFDQQRLSQHFSGLAQTYGIQVGKDGGAEAIQKLTPETFNIEEMLLLELKGREPKKAIKVVLAWGKFIWYTGIGSTQLINLAIEIAHKNNYLTLAIECIFKLGDIASGRSDYKSAIAHFEEALKLYRQIGEVQGEANCILRLGQMATTQSENEQAIAHLEEALKLYRRIGDVQGEANCIHHLGQVATARAENEQATVHFEEALKLFRRIGDVQGEANCLLCLGEVATARSENKQASAHLEEALKLYRRTGDVQGEASCIHSLGEVALARAEYEQATTYFEEALKLYRRIGNVQGEAYCFQGLGKVLLVNSEYEVAGKNLSRALDIFRNTGALGNEAACLFDLGRLALAQQDQCEAQTRFEHSAALFQKVDNPLWLSKCHLRLARLTDDEDSKRQHLEIAHRCQERLATTDLMLLLEQEAANNHD